MSFQRRLGDSDIWVSALGLGSVKIGRNQGVKYPQGFELPDDNAVRNLLAQAHDAGINLVDTAPAYGCSEKRLGQLLSNRHDWVIVTKAGEEFEQGNSYFDFSAAHIRYSVERSLQRLNTDYLDCVLLHSDGDDEQLLHHTDALETLLQLKQQGWVRNVGVSGKTLKGGLDAFDLGADTAMITHNLGYRGEAGVIAAAHQLGRGIFIKKAFASGHLPDDVDDAVQASLALSLQNAGVSSVIAGTINPAHLADNVQKAKAVIADQPVEQAANHE